MAYILTRFVTAAGTTVWLPPRDPQDPADTGGYQSRTLALSAGGVFDPDGDDRPPRGLRKISRRGVVREDSKAAMQATYDALAVASGLRGRLYRQNEVGNRAEWITARLFAEPEDRTVQIVRQDDGHWVLSISTTLELQDKVWHGLRHGTYLAPLDTGIGLDSSVSLDDVADTSTLSTSPITITPTNAGNMPVDDPVLSLLAGSADVTAVTIQCGKAKWTWTGTIKSANTLIIDTGNALVANQTVLTSGAAAGATALSVANAAGTGWAAGGRIRIVLDDGTIVERTIISLGGTTTVNISPGIPGAAASGREVWAAAYSGFARDATLHTIDTWLRFNPGANTLVATLTGGSTTSVLTLFWYDAWA